MFYRVDYVLGVMFLGFLAGAAIASYTKRLSTSRLAGLCYALIAVLVVIRILGYVGSVLVTNGAPWIAASKLFGDATGFTFGALFGLATRRQDAQDFLTSQAILDSQKLMLAFAFAMASVAKAFGMTGMTEFFTQSGYSVAFLKFIVLAEAFGAIGLLLPWANNTAIAGLMIDMFGAVITHIHNGDPLNDSTGAIGMLIRLPALAVLSLWRNGTGRTVHPLRNAVFVTLTGASMCLLIAWGGSVAVRHWSTQAAPLSR